MIISRTPYRVSFFGGGTDYPSWYLKEGGAVLSTTIDKYCYITCRILPPFYEVKYKVVWSHIEVVSTISEILHPAVRNGLKYLGINNGVGLEIHHQGDLPARAGMGSSSSFVVGFFKAMLALKGQMISKKDLAKMAIEFEQDILKENVGSQDQMAAAYGGLNVIRFNTNGDILVEPITISSKRISELENHLMLFYTGNTRLASDIAGDFVRNFDSKVGVLRKMYDIVGSAIEVLTSESDICDFGALLNETWQLKQSVSTKVSSELVNRIYGIALENGAIGGKLLGAGSSGFMLIFAPPEKQPQIKSALSGYQYVPFKFEDAGSVITYYTRARTSENV